MRLRLALGRRGRRASRLVGVRGVADLADQFLDHVLEGGQADGDPVQVDHPRHVRAAPLQRLQSVVQRIIRRDCRERPDPLVLDRAVPAGLVVDAGLTQKTT